MARMVKCVKLGADAEGLIGRRIQAIWVSEFSKMCPKPPGSNGSGSKPC